MVKTNRIKTIFLWSGAISILMLIVLNGYYAPAINEDIDQLGFKVNDKSEIAQEIIQNTLCPCGCGRFLPGSSNRPACFGCSVGKAEVSRIIESLSAGRTPEEMAYEINEPVLVDVYSDYTDEHLSEIWERVKQLAGEFNQHRVVLRPLGLSDEAVRAIRLVECARAKGIFKRIQESLIKHSGPWDEGTLIDLGVEHGMDKEYLADCLSKVDVDAQISKDREHAEILKVETMPAISINRKLSLPTDEDIRRAIRNIIIEESI